MCKKIEKIKDYMKLHQIKIRKISRLMGYHPTYVGLVLNERTRASRQFINLIIFIITEIIDEKIVVYQRDIEELRKINKEE